MKTLIPEKTIVLEKDVEIVKALKDHLNICVNDKFGRITFANDKFCQLVGMPIKSILGQANWFMKSHLHADKTYKNLWKTIEEGDSWEGVFFHKESGSGFKWLQTTIHPIKDKNGAIEKYLSIYNDITDYYQKQTIDNSFELGSKLEVKKFTEITLFINKRAKIIRAKNNLLNKDYDTAIGSYIYDLVNKEYHKAIQSKVKEVFAEKKPSSYHFTSCENLQNRELYVSYIQPVFDKIGEVAYAKITTEIKTKNVKILRQLSETQTKYNSVLKTFKSGIIVVTDSGGIIREFNRGAELAFGFSENEVIGESFTILISKNSIETKGHGLGGIKELISKSSDVETIELLGVKKDGSEFPVELATNSWYCGKEQYFSAIMLDVTKRKNLENRLLQKTKDLELFLYRSAHDLKGPLTTAEGLVGLIKQENIDHSISELVEMLNLSLNRGKLLLDSLGFASTISQKKEELVSINFKKEIQKTLKANEAVDGIEDISFDINIKQTKRFYSNSELLNFMFQNLIRNAINYSKPLSKYHKPHIKINIEQLSDTVTICVSDNGKGIAKENQSKVFDLYYRVANEGVEGTGIGLYIVKCIIENLNGTITLDSQFSEGTSFKITIPNLKNLK